MIEQEKRNCNGYLRTGQILQLMGKPTTALDIYQLGLRNVPPSEVQAKEIQKLRDDLTRRCAPVKAMDPLRILPIEIVEYIIGYMDFRQTVILLRVSKSWQSLLTSMPRLWANLDLRSTRKSARMPAVRNYVKSAQRTCFALQFSRYYETEQKLFSHVASRCQGLRELRISSGIVGTSLVATAHYAKNLRTLILSPRVEVHPQTVNELLHECVNLEHAEFHVQRHMGTVIKFQPLPNLHTLVLNSPLYSGGCLYIQGMKNIRSLTLVNWGIKAIPRLDLSRLKHLEYLDITDVYARWPPALPISIRSLNMTRSSHTETPSIPFELPALPHLEHLFIEGMFPACDNLALTQILKASTAGLRSLSLTCGGEGISCEDIHSLIQNGFLDTIEKFGLAQCRDIDDVLATIIAERLPQLKALDLSNSSVTGVGVKAILKGHGSLEWLGLNDCEHTSLDAVELARSMGVRVSYKSSDHKGGKKVQSQ